MGLIYNEYGVTQLSISLKGGMLGLFEWQRKKLGFHTGKINVSSLFFADDGLLINSDRSEAEYAIRQLQIIAKKYGLKINKEKSSAMLFNSKQSIDQIGGIQVVKEFKYLGITINNGRDIFKTHKDRKTSYVTFTVKFHS